MAVVLERTADRSMEGGIANSTPARQEGTWGRKYVKAHPTSHPLISTGDSQIQQEAMGQRRLLLLHP